MEVLTLQLTLAQKVIKNHLIKGNLFPGQEVMISIDQTLTQDSTGTMAYLEFEAMNPHEIKTKKSIAYIDHNMLQTGSENADDHLYIRSLTKKYGIFFSRPGNGICHQVHLERFTIPGQSLLGSDSHTSTAGAMGMLAIGVGGMDLSIALAKGEYSFIMPEIVKVDLKGSLNPWVSAKDIILELLRRLTVKGGLGKLFEYTGEGVQMLSVYQRATITNMGAELGALTSIFPSDRATLSFLQAQKRIEDFIEISADKDARYRQEIEVDLGQLEPLVACPHSPDHVKTVSALKGLKVDQIIIGSCTNSSFVDLMKVAEILKGRTIPEHVSLAIAPGSMQVLQMLAKVGAISSLVASGARILECACGPCIGMGQSPQTNGISLRTFNRNFKGRSGTPSAEVYLVSPEVAAVSAITGYITDPRDFGAPVVVQEPNEFLVNDHLIIPPSSDPKQISIIRGPNIKPIPKKQVLSTHISGKVLIKLEDNITTDHIMPSNAKLLPYRSNIPYLSDYCLTPCDCNFPKKARDNHGGFIVGGFNYGQGSSREHAALVPLYLGIQAVLAKSFARIHQANLVNSGILPLTFIKRDDYDLVEEGDKLFIENIVEQILKGMVEVKNLSKDIAHEMLLDVTLRQKEILVKGGLLNFIKYHDRESYDV